MSQHTPGPWVYGIRKDGSIWLSMGNPESGPHMQADCDFGEANACLIAAAPDLLEALKACCEELERQDRNNTGTDEHTDLTRAARAAIAKAPQSTEE